MLIRTATRAVVAFVLFNCVCFGCNERQIKTPFILFLKRTKSDIYQIDMWLSWYHLHALTPHSANLTGYSHTHTLLRGQPAEVYSRISRFLLAASGSFSQELYCGLSTSHPLSGDNCCLLLVPSGFCFIQLCLC